MADPTELQLKIEGAVLRHLASAGLSAIDRQVRQMKGVDEAVIYLATLNSALEVWIHDDNVQFCAGRRELCAERYAYETIEEYLDDAIERLQRFLISMGPRG